MPNFAREVRGEICASHIRCCVDWAQTRAAISLEQQRKHHIILDLTRRSRGTVRWVWLIANLCTLGLRLDAQLGQAQRMLHTHSHALQLGSDCSKNKLGDLET